MSRKTITVSEVRYLALVVTSGECLRGDGRAYLIGLLAKTRRRLFLAASMLNPVVAAVLCDSVGRVIAALRGRLLLYTVCS